MKQLYVNGQVFTGTGAMCKAFAVENGKFIAAGDHQQVLSLHMPLEQYFAECFARLCKIAYLFEK